MISIAIDGPSGSGKSTISKELAKRYNLLHVDTGALYRTIGLYAYNCQKSPDDPSEIISLLDTINMDIDFVDGKQIMLLDGKDVSSLIRTNIISTYASKVSAIPEVRNFLLDVQRNLAKKFSVVMDGRDIGTVILPNANLKLFVTVNDKIRAERRWKELIEKGENITFEEVYSTMQQRDFNDSNRKIAPAIPANDAVFIDNSGDFDETIDKICALIDNL